jgi:hypothetical protein
VAFSVCTASRTPVRRTSRRGVGGMYDVRCCGRTLRDEVERHGIADFRRHGRAPLSQEFTHLALMLGIANRTRVGDPQVDLKPTTLGPSPRSRLFLRARSAARFACSSPRRTNARSYRGQSFRKAGASFSRRERMLGDLRYDQVQQRRQPVEENPAPVAQCPIGRGTAI